MRTIHLDCCFLWHICMDVWILHHNIEEHVAGYYCRVGVLYPLVYSPGCKKTRQSCVGPFDVRPWVCICLYSQLGAHTKDTWIKTGLPHCRRDHSLRWDGLCHVLLKPHGR